MGKKNSHYIKETIIIKDIDLKSLLSFRHMGNVTLNRSAEPIANPAVNWNHLPRACLARNASPFCSYSSAIMACWERLELLCPPLSAPGF